MKIKNREELLRQGDTDSRKVVLDVLEETLQAIDSYNILRQMISFDGRFLAVGQKKWDLSQKKNVYLISAGKAANAMTRAFAEILGDRLTAGVSAIKIREEGDDYPHIQVIEGGHPLPNEGSLKAAEAALELASRATPDDLYIGAMSGGCSALISRPREGMTLEDEMTTRDVMLKTGADVVAVNSVCRHISSVNGGYLAKRIEAGGAEIVTFLIMDALGFPATVDRTKPVRFGFTQMAPDATTLAMAKETIKNYGVYHLLPKSVQKFYDSCTEADETPKDLARWTSYLVNTLPDCSNFAKAAAERMGLRSLVLSNCLAGEAREVGTVLASIADEIQQSGQPLDAPCVIVATGEVSTKIDVSEDIGLGGPGQELAASFAIAARKIPGACIASIDSEGTDGPTDCAGGLTDSRTFDLATAKGVDIYGALRSHSAYDALSAVGSKIVTGNTGTNLCDLHVMYVPQRRD